MILEKGKLISSDCTETEIDSGLLSKEKNIVVGNK